MGDEFHFPLTWGSITGKEIHDAGGIDGLGNLVLSLEQAMLRANVVSREPVDLVIIAVPTSKRTVFESFMTTRFGGSIQSNGRMQ